MSFQECFQEEGSRFYRVLGDSGIALSESVGLCMCRVERWVWGLGDHLLPPPWAVWGLCGAVSINLGPEVGGKMVVVWANDLIQDCSGKRCQLHCFWGMGWDALVPIFVPKSCSLGGSAEMENNKALEHTGAGIKQDR